MKKTERLLCIGGIILFLLAVLYLSQGYELPHFEGSMYYEKQWKQQNTETGEILEVELPLAFTYMGNQSGILSAVIDYQPGETESPYAFFTMNHMFFKVYLEGRELYSYMEEDTPKLSRSPGNSYAMVPLPNDCYGKELRIEYWPALESGLTYKVDRVMFGDYATVLYHMYWDNALHNTLIIGILFLGIVLIVISMVMPKDNAGRDVWYIGLFAVILGIYGSTENHFNLYMLSNPYLAYLINIIGFAAIPIPLVLFFKGKTAGFRKAYQVLPVLLGINMAVQFCLHFAGVQDIRQMLIYTHVLYVIAFMLLPVSVIRTPKSIFPNKKMLMLSILPIALGLTVDACIHYSDKVEKVKNSYFMQIGVLIFLIIQAISVFMNIVRLYKENLAGDFYKAMAFKDGLTGVYNRAAFNKEVEELQNSCTQERQVVCVCADINDLKKINDRNGHEAGDFAIRMTADWLNKHLTAYGKVFRIGGDEFTALLYDTDEDKVKKAVADINAEVRQYNAGAQIKVSFAIGYEYMEVSDGRYRVDQCMREADKKMYEHKSAGKRNLYEEIC